jgi:hypothetical protein
MGIVHCPITISSSKTFRMIDYVVMKILYFWTYPMSPYLISNHCQNIIMLRIIVHRTRAKGHSKFNSYAFVNIKFWVTYMIRYNYNTWHAILRVHVHSYITSARISVSSFISPTLPLFICYFLDILPTSFALECAMQLNVPSSNWLFFFSCSYVAVWCSLSCRFPHRFYMGNVWVWSEISVLNWLSLGVFAYSNCVWRHLLNFWFKKCWISE